MKPIIFTREGLYPVWSDLSRQVDDARAEFRAGEHEEIFRHKLRMLGFNWTEIQIEVAQNKPTVRT